MRNLTGGSKREGVVTCETLLTLANGGAAELSVDDGASVVVQSGQVPMSMIDDKLIRRFATMIRFGLFDNPPGNTPVPVQEDGVWTQVPRYTFDGMDFDITN